MPYAAPSRSHLAPFLEGPGPYLVVVAAVALAYLEIYPRRTLRPFGRGHEVDEDMPGMRD